MSHQYIDYKSLSHEEADAKAIADVRNYLSKKQWDTLMEVLADQQTTFQHLNMGLGFCGISGYPVHAMGRKYRLEQYREWMHSGSDPVMTDESGFPLPR